MNGRTIKTGIILLAAIWTATLTSCHSSKKAGGEPFGPATVETIHVGKGDKWGRKVAEEALSWVGTPYRYAGCDKKEGTDCSGMVMRVYEDVTGSKIPRNSAKQAEFCYKLDTNKVETGDLVFFATGKDPKKVSHVGIVVDDNRFVHASSSKGVVVSQLTQPYYQQRLLMFGRVPGHGHELVSDNAGSDQSKKSDESARSDKPDKTNEEYQDPIYF